jgi:hypothetical protein
VPDLANGAFVRHWDADTVDSSRWSPGTRTLGGYFVVPVGAVLLTEVLYDATGSDDGLEWVELYNASDLPIDLSTMSLGAGGSDYTSTLVQLSGLVEPGETFVVGGPISTADNSNPTFDQAVDFVSDLQNSGSEGDGVALFGVRASRVTAATVPVDAVVYGPNNACGLIVETGSTNAPEVGDAPAGPSIVRVTVAGAWQIQSSPTPGSAPL